MKEKRSNTLNLKVWQMIKKQVISVMFLFLLLGGTYAFFVNDLMYFLFAVFSFIGSFVPLTIVEYWFANNDASDQSDMPR